MLIHDGDGRGGWFCTTFFVCCICRLFHSARTASIVTAAAGVYGESMSLDGYGDASRAPWTSRAWRLHNTPAVTHMLPHPLDPHQLNDMSKSRRELPPLFVSRGR